MERNAVDDCYIVVTALTTNLAYPLSQNSEGAKHPSLEAQLPDRCRTSSDSCR